VSIPTADDPTRFNTDHKPNWCPGCGNFGIQTALKKALLELQVAPHRVVMSSGIGCSGKMPHWLNIYGLHGLHGRTLPIATGIKLANQELVVIAEGGDGDGLSEGMNHFIQACRRNVDLTYIIHNNGVFSLTTGQSSTTAKQGFVSKTTPHGSIEVPHNPVALAITAGAGFVARGFSGDTTQLKDLIVAAVRHPGFAFIDVMQVCVTYNPSKSYKWYQERVKKLENSGRDISDRAAALSLAIGAEDEKLLTGVFYEDRRPPYEKSLPQLQGVPLADQAIDKIDIGHLMRKFS
jgi:2-oxoglutarate ferredoxin oxidoreductase subunit beta